MTVRTERPTFAQHWSPRAYLDEYYRTVQPDEDATMAFLGEAATLVGEQPLMLEFGCGPTVHHLLPFGARTDEFHVADYLAGNLDEVRRWAGRAEGAWDWTPFSAHVLRGRLGRHPEPCELRQLEDAVRRRITTIMRADAARCPPIADVRRYPAVLCCFCPDSITDDLAEWERYTHNVASLVDDGGWFVLTALAGACSYRVGDYEFPSPQLDADHVYRALRGAGFAPRATTVVTAAVPDPDGHGFDSVLFAVARRR